MLKEERSLRKWYVTTDDRKEFFDDITALVRAVREDMWNEVEPFIGLDPRHDGNAPDFDKKCPKCEAVRELKAKYAIRGKK